MYDTRMREGVFIPNTERKWDPLKEKKEEGVCSFMEQEGDFISTRRMRELAISC